MKIINIIFILILVTGSLLIFSMNYITEIEKSSIMEGIEHTEPQEGRESYPFPPEIVDCEKLNTTISRNFCLSDVAEINSDMTACGMINDADIEKTCRARVLLDEKICDGINDIGLIESCKESIRLKIKWGTEGI
ncbi:MAG: hypothetical protein KAS04_04865 [Candidatus Aenigmarchaeota archaeon]|nr:hypothetical protein [Candidatus Aenigmarchaeota archaeon]